MKQLADTPRAGPVARVLEAILVVPLKLYQRVVSPLLPRRCKYEPTCSAYAVEAIRELGVARGAVLTAWRLVRCNPFSDGGYDPVEARRLFRDRGASTPPDHRGTPA